jgi:aminoacyl tRNA synthase complex-interacting multifunctional protein 1
MPKLERKADPPKKKEKAPKAVVEGESAAATTSSKKAVEAQGGAAQKKEKKEKKEKAQPVEGAPGKKAGGGGGKGGAAAEDAGEPVPSMIDLRVGHIVDSTFFAFVIFLGADRSTINKVMKHPDADGLYVEVCLPKNFIERCILISTLAN